MLEYISMKLEAIYKYEYVEFVFNSSLPTSSFNPKKIFKIGKLLYKGTGLLNFELNYVR